MDGVGNVCTKVLKKNFEEAPGAVTRIDNNVQI